MSSAKLRIIAVLATLAWVAGAAMAEQSGSHASSGHQQNHGKADDPADECYSQIKKHPYKALLCYEAIDPTLKILLKKDPGGGVLYENLIKACGHDYVSGVVNAKELGSCRKKLTPLDKYSRPS